MAKIKKATAAQSGTEKRELRIVVNDESKKFVPNPNCCLEFIQVIPDWVPPLLYYKMVDALCGYSKGMASLMTDNLIAFLSGGGRHLTGVQHVDEQLLQLYQDVYEYARENGYPLEALF